jgi:tRNA G18 (ribose-2'-O)-methylase SpoU
MKKISYLFFSAAVVVGASANAQLKVEIAGVGSGQIPIAVATFADEGVAPAQMSAIIKAGLERSGAVARHGVAPDRIDLRRPVALVLGNEAWGFAEGVAEHLDAVTTIPMPGRAESLNLAMSASILLYEARRQRDFGS